MEGDHRTLRFTVPGMAEYVLTQARHEGLVLPPRERGSSGPQLLRALLEASEAKEAPPGRPPGMLLSSPLGQNPMSRPATLGAEDQDRHSRTWAPGRSGDGDRRQWPGLLHTQREIEYSTGGQASRYVC